MISSDTSAPGVALPASECVGVRRPDARYVPGGIAGGSKSRRIELPAYASRPPAPALRSDLDAD